MPPGRRFARRNDHNPIQQYSKFLKKGIFYLSLPYYKYNYATHMTKRLIQISKDSVKSNSRAVYENFTVMMETR